MTALEEMAKQRKCVMSAVRDQRHGVAYRTQVLDGWNKDKNRKCRRESRLYRCGKRAFTFDDEIRKCGRIQT